jgi:hypothetical protein
MHSIDCGLHPKQKRSLSQLGGDNKQEERPIIYVLPDKRVLEKIKQTLKDKHIPTCYRG